jgi:hypothetical protein
LSRAASFGRSETTREAGREDKTGLGAVYIPTHREKNAMDGAPECSSRDEDRQQHGKRISNMATDN